MTPLLNRPILLLCLQAAALFIGFEITGHLSVGFQADSDSYLDASRLSMLELLADKRTFPYPMLLRALSHISPDFSLLPEIQFLAHVLTVLIFYRGARDYGFSKAGAVLAASPLLYLRVFWVHVAQVMTDSLAASLAVLTMGLLFMVLSQLTSPMLRGGLALSTTMTYLMRPAYLFIVPLVPLLGWLLSALRERISPFGRPTRLLFGLFLLVLGPLLAFSTLRFALVGHFGLASVGGLNIVSLATQMLTRDIMARLPPETQKLALAIIDRREKDREAMEAKRCADPLKVRHTHYVMYEVFTECYNYHGIMSEQVAMSLYSGRSESPDLVIVNRKLTELSLAILKERPVHYAYWLFYSFMYGISVVIRYDYPVVILVMLLCAFQLAIAMQAHYMGKATILLPMAVAPLELCSMTLMAMSFFLSGLLLIILVEPAVSRYVFAVDMFLPSILALAVFSVFARYRVMHAVAWPKEEPASLAKSKS